jgi:hypothetical protein
MKNTIIISIDTERDTPIRIGKPEGTNPTTPEELKEMTLNDINCIAETLCHLINLSAVNGYGDKKELMDSTLVKIHTILNEKEEEDTEQMAYEKAKLIIENLETVQQVPAAVNFIDLYSVQFNNDERYFELNSLLKEKRKHLTL